MVWDLLLKADPEGPSPIFHAALRHSFHTPTVTPQHVSLQHTLVKNPSTLVIGVTDWLLRADNYARARGIPSSDKPRAEPPTSSPASQRGSFFLRGASAIAELARAAVGATITGNG